MIYKKNEGSLELVNVGTNEKWAFTAAGLGEMSYLKASPNGEWIAILNRPDTTELVKNVFLVHLTDKDYRIIPTPQGSNIEDFSWYTDKELIVNTYTTDGTMTQESYIINLDDLEDQG